MAKEIKFNIKLNVDGKEVVGAAVSDVKELRKAWEDSRTAMQKVVEESFKFNQISQGIQNLRSALDSITTESRTFAGAMHEANTMAGKGAEEFGKLQEQVTELSKTIPIARDQLARGLYQVISNGVPEDNWISYLEATSKAAVGGIANLEEVVKVTSTIIKNYGMSWDDALTIQDKIQLTAKNGVTSFEQLASAPPSVTGQAAQLGVSLDEMLAVMATLTGVTGNTSEVSTQLASVLTAMTKESSKAQKMAAEMGISFNAASIKAAGGLQNFIQQLDNTVTAYAQKTGQLRESIYSKLFGRAEALRLVNGLTGELAEKFGENIAVMKESMGTIDEAFGEMAETASSL